MRLRRLLTLSAALALTAACGDGSSPSGPGSDPAPTATSVSLSPGSATSTALGDTVAFSAEVLDQNGSAMGGVTIGWSSSDDSVATVGDGDAVARGNGTARIVASAEGLADTATLTVDQEASGVTVTPATDTLAVGDSTHLSAEATDANGNPVAGPDVSWTSADTAVAVVDSTGLVRTRADGSVSVTARVDAATDTFALTVLPPPDGAPAVTSVSPSPMPEGATATLSGTNFSPDPASNTVLVDGDTARVTSATSTSLEIEVPLYDCLPARAVTVEVTTSAGSDSNSFQLAPEEPAISLATGAMTRIETPGDFCLQFPETSSSERYLVGVQSLSGTASSLTPVQITAEAVGGSGAALEASLDRTGTLETSEREIRELDVPERWRTHREAERELRRKEREMWEGGDLTPASASSGAVVTRISVDSTAAEGDTVSIRVPDISTSSLCTSYTEVGAVVKAVGTRAIVVADTANPANGYTDTDYRDLSDRIDQDIFSTQVSYFGQPTDIDSNGHIVAVFTKELNRTSPGTLGFVSSTDLADRSSCESSNEGEYFYGKVPDPNGTYGSTYSVSDAKQDAPFVMAHELAHVIQQSRRLTNGKPWMGSIVAEAQATLSEEVVGHAVTGRQSGQNYGYDVAFNASGTDEIDWYANAFTDLAYYFGYESSTSEVSGAPEECGWWQSSTSPCGGRSFWYGVGWSFLRWVTDRYGPSHSGGETGFHRDLVDGDQEGLATIETLTGEPLEKLMARWAASLYGDDRIASPEPYLETSSWDYFDIFENNLESSAGDPATLNPSEMGFADWSLSGDVRASSAAYVAVESAGRPATAIRVRDGTDGTLPTDMQIWVVRLQ